MNMQFLNASQNIPYSRLLQKKQTIPIMFQSTRSIIPKIELIKNEQDLEPEVKKMIWGPAIWFLFHTLAEKIKEDFFSSIRVELLNNIYSICVNLPCPMCSMHAKEYLDKINFNSIQKKEDLKNMLYEFHNNVNLKKNISLFPKDQLDEKYSKAVTINIIHNFMFYFKDKTRSPKLIANDLQRSHIFNLLRNWFSKNIGYFEA
jgi:hypothetical protein